MVSYSEATKWFMVFDYLLGRFLEKILDCTKEAVWGVSSGSGMRQRAAVMNSVKATNARRPRRANRKSRAMATVTTTEAETGEASTGAHYILYTLV